MSQGKKFTARDARMRCMLEGMESRVLLSMSPIVLGGNGQDLATSVAADGAGNIYIAGTFQGTVDFDYGSAARTLTASGVRSVFVAKYSPTGACIWAKQLGGLSSDADDDGMLGISGRIAVDSAGAVYVTGAFSGQRDFDPNGGVLKLTSAGKTDIFIAKLSSAGSLVWARSIGGGESDKGIGLALDSSNNMLVTGYFGASADFNPGAGTTKLTSLGGHDAFILKLTNAGTFTWARRLGSNQPTLGGDWGWGIASDALGNVYVSGMFTGTATLTPSTKATKVVSAGKKDVFVAKLSAAGVPGWCVRAGGAGSDMATDVVVDSAGYVYVSGAFEGRSDFNPSATAASYLASAGSADGFLLKLTGAGKFAKAARFGSSGADAVWDLATRSGGLYAVGMFSLSPTYGSAYCGAISKGATDVFIVRLQTSNLALDWGYSSGNVVDDWGLAVALDGSNNALVAGFMSGSAAVNLSGTSDLLSSGDVVLCKLNASGYLV